MMARDSETSQAVACWPAKFVHKASTSESASPSGPVIHHSLGPSQRICQTPPLETVFAALGNARPVAVCTADEKAGSEALPRMLTMVRCGTSAMTMPAPAFLLEA